MWFFGVFSRVRRSAVQANSFRRDVNTINDTSWAFAELFHFHFSIIFCVFGQRQWAIINSPMAEAMHLAGQWTQKEILHSTFGRDGNGKIPFRNNYVQFGAFISSAADAQHWEIGTKRGKKQLGAMNRPIYHNFNAGNLWTLPVAIWQWVKQAQSIVRTAVDVTV